MTGLLMLLLVVLVVCVIIWATQRLTTAFAVGEPLKTVIIVAVVIILILWLLRYFHLGL